MYQCTLFGLDESGKVMATEEMQVRQLQDAVQIAHERLPRFARVEVWQSFVCVARLRRS